MQMAAERNEAGQAAGVLQQLPDAQHRPLSQCPTLHWLGPLQAAPLSFFATQVEPSQ